MPRSVLKMGLLVATLASSALAQGSLTGRVFALADNDRAPAPGAWIIASSGSPPRTVATAQADAQGVYRLDGLPEGRVEFTVSHRGYFALEAGGVSAATLARVCPASGSCGEADFVIAQASVVEGYVTDPFGDPLADAAVRLTEQGETGEPEGRGPRRGPSRRRFAGADNRLMKATDDRGYFRFYGIAPGEYQLQIEADRFFFGEAYSTEPLEVTVEMGRSNSPIYIAMSVSAEPVRIGGLIEGLSLRPGEMVRLMAANVNPGASRRPPFAGLQVEADESGTPRISGQLPPGEYVLTAQIVDASPGGLRRGPRVVTLGRRRIDSDVTDLRLTATAGASFSGRIRFEDMSPRRANLVLVPLDGGTPEYLRFGPNGRSAGRGDFGGRGETEEARFERTGLLPGRYRLRANSDEYFITSEMEFALSDGQDLDTEIVLSGAFGEIAGTVRRPEASAASGPIVVALRDGNGKIVSIQADAAGQYRFAKLRPGDYQICAWSDTTVNPQSEQIWNAAGAAVREFPVTAGDQIEIVLTAIP